MKIALVIDDTLDNPDGVQQTTLAMGHYLSQQGCQVSYLTSSSKRDDIKNIYSFAKLLSFKFNGNYVNTPYRTDNEKLQRILCENEFDIVHVQAPYSPFLAGKIIRSLPAKTKVIVHFHIVPRNFIVDLSIRTLKLLVFRSLQRVDYFIGNTKPMANYFKRVWKLPQIEIIPNAVNVGDYPAQSRSYHVANKINIVFLGRLVERKGCIDLIKAVGNLQADLQAKIHLHIGGRGKLEAQVRQHIKQLNLDSITTCHGFINEEDKPKFLASGDLLVFPSRGGESFGNSIIEALASGHGVVLAAHNMGYDTILSNHPQQMFNPKVQSLVHCLTYWLTSTPADYEEALTWQNKQLQKYDLETIVGPKIIQVYKHLLS